VKHVTEIRTAAILSKNLIRNQLRQWRNCWRQWLNYAAIAATSVQHLVWEVKIDKGWISFAADATGQLEAQYQSASPAALTMPINGINYKVDVKAMTQTNPSSSKLRHLRRLGDFAWECETDSGWTPYDAPIALALERGYMDWKTARLGGKADRNAVEFSRDGKKFEVKLEDMQQVNKATGYLRRVRRLGPVAWEVEADDGSWLPYGRSDADLLERAWAGASSGAQSVVSTGSSAYKVDVKAMKQTNTTTSNVRRVRRVPAAAWGWDLDGEWVLYSAPDALALERAAMSGGGTVTLRSGLYTVDVGAMRQTRAGSGFPRAVRRELPPPSAAAAAGPQTPPATAARPATPAPQSVRAGTPGPGGRGGTAAATVAADDVPGTWTRWSAAKAGLEEVAVGSAEWGDVAALFGKTGGSLKVTRVQRVQNHALWAPFAAARRAMDARGAPGANEMRLFHGTPADSVDKIVQQGFNRSFVSTHAYGMGTYFARDASYSAAPSYSKPDAAGDCRMFLARVLVGSACVGASSDRVPPQPRPGGAGPHDLCDTTVNQVQRLARAV
jgi:hypothetical protein